MFWGTYLADPFLNVYRSGKSGSENDSFVLLKPENDKLVFL